MPPNLLWVFFCFGVWRGLDSFVGRRRWRSVLEGTSGRGVFTFVEGIVHVLLECAFKASKAPLDDYDFRERKIDERERSFEGEGGCLDLDRPIHVWTTRMRAGYYYFAPKNFSVGWE